MATDVTTTVAASSRAPAEPDDARLQALVDEASASVQQDTSAATNRLGDLMVEAARRGLHDLEAQAAYAAARGQVNLGHLDRALELITRARDLWESQGESLKAWRTDLGRMHVLDDLGRHADSLDVGAMLVQRLEVDGDPDDDEQSWMRAAVLENLGVSHGYLGDHRQAMEAYGRAEAAYRDLGMDDDVARPMGNRGVELLALGRPGEALEAFTAAVEGFVDQDDRLYAAMFTAYQARAHVLMGSHLQAAAAIQRASDLLDGQEETTEHARTQLVRAAALASLNLLVEALDLYDDILARFRTAGLRHDQADALYGRGVVLMRMGRRREAREALGRAAELYAEVSTAVVAAGPRLVESRLVDEAAARTIVAHVLDELADTAPPEVLAAALTRRAQLEPDVDRAGDVLDRAEAALVGTNIVRARWRLLHERGRWLARVGRTDEARAVLERAVAVIEDERSTVAAEYQLLSFMARREHVLQELVRLDLEVGDVDRAYMRSEHARARTLSEIQRGDVRSGPAPSSAEVNRIYERLLRATPAGQGPLRREARARERRPAAGQRPLHRGDRIAPVMAPPPETVTVTYQVLGDEVMAFVHADGRLTVVRDLVTVATVQELLRDLDAQWRRMGDRGIAARHPERLRAVAEDVLQRLYLHLLAPLPSLAEDSNLVVVPHGPLGNVPFAALHDGGGHLVDRLTVTMAPSRLVASQARDRARSRWDRRLVVGVVSPETPEVAAEVEDVAATVDAPTVLLDAEATVTSLREHLARHDVVHLAGHGVHRPDSPEFSAIRLGDRWLTATEVPELDLDGQLVVLSACSTGRQAAAGSGDELVGLPRAFLAAGASSVVVNLWQVDDAAARTLMANFHRHLGARDPSAALRAAQLDTRAHHPHPFHWAPSVVFGTPDRTESP